MNLLETIWQALNSPLGIAAVAGLVLWLLNRLYAARPGWKKYEGAIISAVKFAEKQIPDDTENKGLLRLDAAMRYVLKVYAETTGKQASDKVAADLKEGVQIKHAELEAAEALRPSAEAGVA